MTDRGGAELTSPDVRLRGSGRQPDHGGRQGGSLTVLAVVVVASIVAWLRLTPTARDTLWAEDGRVFLWDAFTTPAGTTLLRPYDGYLHVLPRAVAEAVSALLPPQRYALVITAVACLVAGAAAGVVYVCSRAVTGSRALRLAFAAVTVMVPMLPLEVLGNLANVHWFGLWLMPWLLLYRPRTWPSASVLGVVSLVCALTEIQTVFFVPLVLWRWRERRGWPVRGGLLLGLAAQGAALATAERAPHPGPLPGAVDVAQGFLVDAVSTLWWGSGRTVTWVVMTFGWAAVGVVALVTGAAVLLVLRRGDTTQRLAAVVLPATSALTWTAAVYLNKPQATWDRPASGTTTELTLLRYGVVPSMFLLATLLLALAVLPRRPAAYGAAVLCAVPLVLAAATTLVPATTARSGGPSWSPQVEDARTACLADPAMPYLELTIAPPGWVSRVPCDVLEGNP